MLESAQQYVITFIDFTLRLFGSVQFSVAPKNVFHIREKGVKGK